MREGSWSGNCKLLKAHFCDMIPRECNDEHEQGVIEGIGPRMIELIGRM